MKTAFPIGLVCALVSSAAAQGTAEWQKTLQVYDWKGPEFQQAYPAGEVISTNGVFVLKIENTNNAPLEISLLKITNASAIKRATSISCEMKYENVLYHLVEHTDRFLPGRTFTTAESGSLKLINHIPPSAPGGDERTNESAFSFEGTSNWKLYEFTVDRGQPEGLPAQLEFKLSLPTNGTVYLRPIKLLGMVGNWWSPKQAGMIGGIGGSVIGCFGGLLGCLAGMGKARRFVLAMTHIFIGLGILLTIAGLIAAVCKQPYAVWYTLLLPGGILTLVFGVNLYPIKRRYDDLEIRRMTSIDV